MEIHKPKPIHNFREFLKEVGIIVLGVLIALGAEQTVEALHWRAKVHEAEQAMRLELRDDDGPQAFTRAAIEACLDHQLDTIQVAVEGGRDRRAIAALADAYTPPTRTWDAEAWRTAVASDAASHTSADRMVTWSKPYRLLPVLEATNLAEASERIELQPTRRAGGPLSGAEQDRMLSAVARLRQANHMIAGWSRATLLGLSRNKIAVARDNQARILAGYRNRYGSCVVAPSFSGVDPTDQLRDAAGDRPLEPARVAPRTAVIAR
jgi:hypothetical protein